MEVIENNANNNIIKLTKNELVMVNNALNEILRGPDAIEEWEFHTRIGATREEAEKLFDMIKALSK
ncbi:MAG: hypothetical protein AAB483_02925 [Patescibacteria group bacterium]